MDNTQELEFYATPGPMTDVSSCPAELLERLPSDAAGLMRVVRGCVVSDLMLTQIYKLPVPAGREREAQIRPAAEMVRRIKELDPSPLIDARPPEQRFLGNCRHFATLSCALLRRAGTPTRVRAGFAGYFVPNTWVDHWIIEYWRPGESRWIRVDPQLDDEWLAKRAPGTTSESLAQGLYLSGGEAWRRCRRGELDPGRFNMGGSNWGIGEIRGSVLYDLAALNQDEMLPWDCWARMEDAYQHKTDERYDAMLDEVADVISSGRFDGVRSVYQENEDLTVSASLLSS